MRFFGRSPKPHAIATELMQFPHRLSSDVCRGHLPGEVEAAALAQWTAESQLLVGATVIRACRTLVSPGSTNDALQQALYEEFVAEQTKEQVAEALAKLLAARTATYSEDFDALMGRKRDLLSVLGTLSMRYTGFTSGTPTVVVG